MSIHTNWRLVNIIQDFYWNLSDNVMPSSICNPFQITVMNSLYVTGGYIVFVFGPYLFVN